MSIGGETRIGVIVPAGNVVHQREFARLAGAGVDFRFADFTYPATDTTDFRADLLERLAAPFAELRGWGARATLLGCTTASMTCFGEDFDADLVALAGVPVVTAAGAVVDAGRALGAGTFAVATPYGDTANSVVAGFLEGEGFTISSIEGLALDATPAAWASVPDIRTEVVVGLSLRVDRPEARAICLPCTAMPSLDAIIACEERVRKPVFSSVQAGYRSVMTCAGLDARRPGAGRLLDPAREIA